MSAQPDDTHVIDSALALKAMAHPLRFKMLGALRFGGSTTATELARRYGESTGVTSYHLRLLAKHGFIEEDQEQTNGRERRWRAVHRYSRWGGPLAPADDESRQAMRLLRDQQRVLAFQNAERFDREIETWSQPWGEVAGQADYTVRLSPATAAELRDRFAAFVEELADRDGESADTQHVSIFLAIFPTREYES